MKKLLAILFVFAGLTSYGQGLVNIKETVSGSSKYRALISSDIPSLSSIYQPLLVSGTNIKTINSQSLLGSGNITISAGVWGSITGTITDQLDLISTLAGYQPIDGDLTTLAGLPTGGGVADYAVVLNGSGTGFTTSQRVANPNNANGSLMYWLQTPTPTFVTIPIGTNGYVLTSNGSIPSWQPAAGGGGSGTVTDIATTSPITGGPITTTGTIGINNSAADGTTKGAASFTANDFDASSGNISIDYTNGQAASGSTKGFLTSANWTTFNGKQDGDADLTAIAGLTPTNDDIIQRKAGAWVNRTMTQLAADLPVTSVGKGGTNNSSFTGLALIAMGTGSSMQSVGTSATTSGGLFLDDFTNMILNQVRLVTVTAQPVAASRLTAMSSNTIADGFGPTQVYQISNALGAQTGIADIGAVRDGAINSGKWVLRTYNGGTATAHINVSSTGNVAIGQSTTTGNSTLQVTGSTSYAYVAKTALYTLTGSDHTVEVTSGTHTQTLPTAVGITGRVYVITNSGAGVVTVGTTSSQTFVNVSGTPTTLTLNQFQTVIVQSNGTNWLRLSTI